MHPVFFGHWSVYCSLKPKYTSEPATSPLRFQVYLLTTKTSLIATRPDVKREQQSNFCLLFTWTALGSCPACPECHQKKKQHNLFILTAIRVQEKLVSRFLCQELVFPPGSGPSIDWGTCAVLCRQNGSPVRLVEVDVESLGPVGKHLLLCDEAMVASMLATLMRQIHCTLRDLGGSVVVIMDRLGWISVPEKGKRYKQVLGRYAKCSVKRSKQINMLWLLLFVHN